MYIFFGFFVFTVKKVLHFVPSGASPFRSTGFIIHAYRIFRLHEKQHTLYTFLIKSIQGFSLENPISIGKTMQN